jgi:hypothetical protein
VDAEHNFIRYAALHNTLVSQIICLPFLPQVPRLNKSNQFLLIANSENLELT